MFMVIENLVEILFEVSESPVDYGSLEANTFFCLFLGRHEKVFQKKCVKGKPGASMVFVRPKDKFSFPADLMVFPARKLC